MPSEVLGDIPQRPSSNSPNSQVGKDDIGQHLWQPDLRPRTDQGEQAVPGKRRYPVGGFQPVTSFGAGAGRLVGVQPLGIADRGEHRQPKRVALLELGQVPLLGSGLLAETLPFSRCGASRCAAALLSCWAVASRSRLSVTSASRWVVASRSRRSAASACTSRARTTASRLSPAGNAVIRRRAATTSWLRASTKPLCTTTPSSSSSGRMAISYSQLG